MKNNYHKIFYKSVIPTSLKGSLEKIFYFNKNQSIYIDKIEKSVEKYGVISIIEKNNTVTLSLSKLQNSKILFALDGESNEAELIGVIVFTINNKIGEIIHIAVDPLCAASGSLNRELITFRLMDKAREEFKKYRVDKYILPYRNNLININVKLTMVLE